MATKSMVTREGEEIWETQTDGRIWVEVVVDKARGTTKMINVQGKGSRLRLSTEDRKMAQERVRDDKNDPFINGMLVRIDADQQKEEDTASPSALSDADLSKIFTYKQNARFLTALEDLSEVSLRRLWALAQDDENVGSVQKEKIKNHLNEKFGVNRGKDDRRHDSAEAISADFPVMRLTN